MTAFKCSLNSCEPQVNKCSTGLSPTVAVRAGTCFLAIPFVSRLKATFRYPLTTEAILSVFLGRMDSAAENQRKTGDGEDERVHMLQCSRTHPAHQGWTVA